MQKSLGQHQVALSHLVGKVNNLVERKNKKLQKLRAAKKNNELEIGSKNFEKNNRASPKSGPGTIKSGFGAKKK